MNEGVTPEDPFLAAANRALGIVDSRGGVGVAKANHRADRYLDVALVELMVASIREGFVAPPGFLAQPAHLPDGDDLRALARSVGSRDAALRMDMSEWVQINRREASLGGTTLKNAIKAVRIAKTLLDESDEDDVRISEMKAEIETHLYRTYKLTAVEAPENEYALDRWCVAFLVKLSPVPEWLRENTVTTPKNIFVPETRKQPSNLRRYEPKDDDDER